MGFVTRFFVKPTKQALVQLPTGSFTMDREGHIMTSTLPQSFPAAMIQAIGDQVLAAFRSARRAQMPLSELIIHYSALKLLARELRGGAMIFLMPQTLITHSPTKPAATKRP
jgi:hypothetical protein